MYCILLFCGLLSLVFGESPQSRLVQLSQGPVRGYQHKNDENIFIFYGIPYATVPTGRDRFKAPLPPPVWSEPFEAVDDTIICPQSDILSNIIPQSKIIQEDCLVVNVFMPETNGAKLPVVVQFHGGGFSFGWGDTLTNAYAIKSKKVVGVTFNNRLGAHGFLCLGTEDVPGNAGMKDQVALLQWVKQNIGNFGGDPDDVTLAGFNAGSASVELLMLSKMAKGLFKKGILASGSSMAAFSVQLNPIENAKKYADMLKFENLEDFYQLENYYKNISFKELNAPYALGRPDQTILMSPCVERDVGEERFLDDNPINILKSGNFEKLPMLYGFSEMDGQFRLPLLDYWSEYMDIIFELFLPGDLHFKDESEKKKVAKEIKSFYFGDKFIGKETIPQYIDYFTDIMFAYPMLRSLKLQVEAGNKNIYLYEFSKSIDENPAKLYANFSNLDQCGKTLEAFDDYWNEAQNNEYDSNDHTKGITIVERLWTNFITKGKPISPGSKLGVWPPVGVNNSPHMYMSKSLELRGTLLKKRTRFWDKIYDKYYLYPSAPPAPPLKPSRF